MQDQRARPSAAAGPRRGPGGRRAGHGPPWRGGHGGEEGPGGLGRFARRVGRGDRLPWPSTVVVGVIVMVGTTVAAHGQGREPLGLVARLLLLTAVAVLLVRHRHPVVAVAGTAAATLVYLGLGYPYGPVFLAVAVGCFSAIVAGHRTAAWWSLGALWAGHLLVAHWLYRWLPPDGDGPAPWGQEAFITAWVVAVVAAAELLRVRREQWAAARAEREAAEKRRADEERLRMARELHDVLAHSISVINVQAGVGLALLDSDPEQARTALTTIKSASKEALGEVRQVLENLRTPGDAPRAPAPGLDRLPELVDQAAGAGLTVTVETDGGRGQVPPGTDLAAFRIVQEALTNVVRHSGSRTARVRIAYGREHLGLLVDDEGPATGDDAGGSGNGLIGMRERAAALGGTIDAGPRPDGGFRVTAELPLRPGLGGPAARDETGTEWAS
ncbi:sensor histidine kinase [Streptomyces sp. QL37]|uniref:sensor histidine kinase n=1 Tax=Streptomyces sp. QL37 TaxID=2093747 RepID=UPI000CF24ECA|nr:sensor histidine kinase [Streptomyces sp. QL37]PPQ61514.1 two-component sensor histidine kinase [Streptomyces sp. QL37]